MTIVLWIIQVLLGLAFLAAGSMKVSQPIEKLQTNMGWVTHTPKGIVRLVGTLEILGGIGLILPGAVHILVWLTIAAAVGLTLTMIGAIIFHIVLRDKPAVFSGPIILLLLSLFIVIGRLLIAPF